MEPENLNAWGAGIAGFIAAVGLGTWAIVERIKASRLKFREEENRVNLEEALSRLKLKKEVDSDEVELASRIKADSTERERQRLEAQAASFRDIIKEDRKQFDKLDKRMDEALAMAQIAQKEHIECEKDRAAQKQRISDMERRGEEQEARIHELEERIAKLEGRNG